MELNDKLINEKIAEKDKSLFLTLEDEMARSDKYLHPQRNQFCFCGSQKKYKKCCIEKERLKSSYDNLQMYEFNLTDDVVLPLPKEMSDKEQRKYNKMLDRIINNKAKKEAQQLLHYCSVYPHHPVFHHHLSCVYYQLGEEEKSWQLAEQVVEKFPKYIFGYVFLVRLFLDKGKFDQAKQLLRNKRMVSDVDKERKTFHVKEYLIMECVWSEFHSIDGNLAAAIKTLEDAKKICNNFECDFRGSGVDRAMETLNTAKLIRKFEVIRNNPSILREIGCGT